MMDQSKLVKQFIKESKTHLASIETCLISIEKSGDKKSDLSKEIDHLFMGFHGIKGISDIVGHTCILSLSHQAEDLLSDLRDHKIIFEMRYSDVLLLSHDLIRDMLNELKPENAKLNKLSKALSKRYDILLNQLKSLSGSSPDSTDKQTKKSDKLLLKVNENEKLKSVSVPKLDGLRDSFKEASIDHLNVIKRFCDHFDLMKVTKSEWKRINRTLKLFELGATRAKLDTVIDEFNIFKKILSEAESGSVSDLTQKDLKKSFDRLKKSVSGEEDDEKGLIANSQESEGVQPVLRSEITLEAKTADQLVSDVSDLSVLKNELDHKLEALRQIDSSLAKEYIGIAKTLGKISGSLQKNVLELRMTPVSQLFARFPRMVRDLSRACGKDVDLELKGESTRIDYHVMECLNDPLVHMIRNSVDHGIETPEERQNLGKDRASIRLEAFRTRGQVVIEVSDDGRGLNQEKIISKALKLGLLTEDELAKMSDEEKQNLIFHPGLSTAEKTTTISGRGVGMASVRDHLEKIQGRVTVSSVAGEGTRIQLSVPLTLAIEPSILIEASEVLYAIPMSKVSESLRVDDHMYEGGKLSDLIGYRGEVLPVVDLSQLFSIENGHQELPNRTVKKGRFGKKLCVVRSESGQIGLVVDRILEAQELLIKPLPALFKSVRGFSGASTLGDGRMILMLDAESLRDLMDNKKYSQTALAS